MNNMNNLYEAFQTAERNLPFKPNSVRSILDFQILPHIIYSDATVFINNCMTDREKFICALFNQYYELTNPSRYPLSPKIFHEDDFAVHLRKVASGKHLIQIYLPSEFAESMEFCTAYVITYETAGTSIFNERFFAIMDSMYGWKQLVYISPGYEQRYLGHCTENIERDLHTICQFAFADYFFDIIK